MQPLLSGKDLEELSNREPDMVIDIEPTWVDILKVAIKKEKDPAVLHMLKELEPALEITDIVRQAQKKGRKNVLFDFGAPNDPSMSIKYDVMYTE